MVAKKSVLCVIILFIMLPIGITNSINITESNQLNSNHNQVANHHIISKDYFQYEVFTKSNTTSTNKQSVMAPSRLNTITSVNGFISTWNTSKTSAGSSNKLQIRLPLVSDGKYDFNILWGDGTNNTITTYNQPQITHTYSHSGVYTLNITGGILGWRFNGKGDVFKLIKISNWGPLRLGNDGFYFSDAINLVLTTTDALNLNGTTNLTHMFYNCNLLGNSGNLNSWNVSQVTNMAFMFYGSAFNQSLDKWDVSHVIDMKAMLGGTSFNQPLDSWNVSQVTNMSYMFFGTWYFNQPLDLWNVSHVTTMSQMFFYDSAFNQPLGSWNVSQVDNMAQMLSNTSLSTSNYNQLLEGWSSLPKLMQNVYFDVGNAKYSSLAQKARSKLIHDFGWIISDGGLADSHNLLFNQVIEEGFIVVILSLFVVISSYLSFEFVKYRRNKKKNIQKDSNFWNYLKNSFIFKKHKPIQREMLNPKTLDKINEIINENSLPKSDYLKEDDIE